MIDYFSMFNGIGGFEYGVEQTTKEWECVGCSEIDTYASAIYRYHYPEHRNYGDATAINTSELPDFDMLIAGFPCQSFSIAGKREGFNDTRGTLFFEIARILRDKRPRYFLLENVKHLVGHDDGKTFTTILGILADIGYELQWQVLNSKDFGVPQNRERVFIIGHIRGERRPEVFPIGEEHGEITQKEYEQCVSGTISTKNQSGQAQWDGSTTLVQIGNKGHNSISGRVYNTEGLAISINAHGGGQGAKTGLYAVCDSGLHRKSQIRNDILPPLRANTGAGHNNIVMISRPHGFNKGGEKELPCLRGSAMEQNDFLKNATYIRRLTPIECEKLQGFPDGWTKYGLFVMPNSLVTDGVVKEISDTQRYKCLGNAVTTNVITEIMRRFLS